jgi:hypothetical protein
MTNYDPASFASTEYQALLAEVRAAGGSEELITRLAERHVTELSRKADKVQADVFDIGEQIRTRIDQLETKLDADVRSRLGATNEMLVDLLQTQQTDRDMWTDTLAITKELQVRSVSLEAGFREIGESVDGLRKNFDTFRGETSTELHTAKQERARILDRLAVKRAWLERHDAELAELRARVFAYDDRISPEERERMTAQLFEILRAWPLIKARLEADDG